MTYNSAKNEKIKTNPNSIKKRIRDFESFFKSKHSYAKGTSSSSFRPQDAKLKFLKIDNDYTYQPKNIPSFDDLKMTFKSIPMPKNANTLYNVLFKKQNEV